LDGGCETTEDRGRKTEKNGISNIEQGISNDEGRRAEIGRTANQGAGYQAVREKIEDRGRKTGDRISEFEIRDLDPSLRLDSG